MDRDGGHGEGCRHWLAPAGAAEVTAHGGELAALWCAGGSRWEAGCWLLSPELRPYCRRGAPPQPRTAVRRSRIIRELSAGLPRNTNAGCRQTGLRHAHPAISEDGDVPIVPSLGWPSVHINRPVR